MVVKLAVAVVSIVYLAAIVAAVIYFAFAGPSQDLTGRQDEEDASAAD